MLLATIRMGLRKPVGFLIYVYFFIEFPAIHIANQRGFINQKLQQTKWGFKE